MSIEEDFEAAMNADPFPRPPDRAPRAFPLPCGERQYIPLIPKLGIYLGVIRCERPRGHKGSHAIHWGMR